MSENPPAPNGASELFPLVYGELPKDLSTMFQRLFLALRRRLFPIEPVVQGLKAVRRDLKALECSQRADVKRFSGSVKHAVSDASKATDRQVTASLARLERHMMHLATRVDEQVVQHRLLLRRVEYLSLGAEEKTSPAAASLAPRPRSTMLEIPNGEGTEHRLSACPVCEGDRFTVVNEWNKLLLYPGLADAPARRYDFAVCHQCGVLFASLRPVGDRYRYLLDNFIEAAGKESQNNPVLNPYPLTDADREDLRTRIRHGVFVSDHRPIPAGHLPGAFKDRIGVSMHSEILSSLLSLRGAHILELRPKLGGLLASLKRQHGAHVYGMPIFESQQLVLQELYGIEASALIDFENFVIPYPKTFDLIISHHIFTHALRPLEFFAELRRNLAPGGHVYFYDELDDAEFTSGMQSMIATLNAFHFQTADRPSFQRALAANGFEVVFQKTLDNRHTCLARQSETVQFVPAGKDEISLRVAALQRARDRALLKLPIAVRGETGEDWEALTERAVATGIATVGEDGRVRLVRAKG